MPELPEVQTVVTDLKKKVLKKTIVKVWLDWPKMIKDPKKQSFRKVNKKAVENFKRQIRDKKILDVKRIAKNILIYLSGDKVLLIHQKMTGHLLIGRWRVEKNKVIPISPKAVVSDPYNGYIRLILYLNNNKMIALSDLRRFAKVILGTKKEIENLPEILALGPDALAKELTLKKFTKIIQSQTRKIKQVLLDPNVIAGIGNIYSDEILWKAKIHPKRRANEIKEIKALYQATRSILKKAVKLRGTSTSDFRDPSGEKGNYTNQRLVYQKQGEPCKRCKNKIKRIKVGGRSAHYCENCQK